VTSIENPKSQSANAAEPLPLSLLNDFLYCSRRAALKIVEGWRSANEHTARGDIIHEHTDLPGYEVAKGVTLLRALPVWSERLGLNGKCDIVEVHRTHTGDETARRTLPRSVRTPERSDLSSYEALVPVEFKVGRRRQWENDDVQLCAQALCLEEMFSVPVPRGAIFHADSKRRREVEFTPELRASTEAAAGELHQLLASNRVPPAVFKPACEECSLFDICLPRLTDGSGAAARAARRLFEV
jgi:CRISPR-associated exonuclease Cas4